MMEGADIFVDAGLVEGQRPAIALSVPKADESGVVILGWIVGSARHGRFINLRVHDEKRRSLGLGFCNERFGNRRAWSERDGVAVLRLPDHRISGLHRQVLRMIIEAHSPHLARE